MSNETNELQTNVVKCARCGEDHAVIFFKFKTKPITCGGAVWTHWGICPISKEPLLMYIHEVKVTAQ